MALETIQGFEHIVPIRLRIPYKNTYGLTASKFFTELRDHAQLLGTTCPKCNLVYLPPKSICPRCFDSLEEWVKVSDKGTLLTYTLVDYSCDPSYQPINPPYACGIIQLDGASTGLVHLLGEVEFNQIKIGMRLQAIFKPANERQGDILDISYFKPL